MPFVTEALWAALPRAAADPELLIVARWPQAPQLAALRDPIAERNVGEVLELVTAIRNARAEARIEPAAWLDAQLAAPADAGRGRPRPADRRSSVSLGSRRPCRPATWRRTARAASSQVVAGRLQASLVPPGRSRHDRPRRRSPREGACAGRGCIGQHAGAPRRPRIPRAGPGARRGGRPDARGGARRSRRPACRPRGPRGRSQDAGASGSRQPLPERSGDWWRHGVVYQVYPRSFADGNGDGLGDLRGIIEHLDHLNDGTPRPSASTRSGCRRSTRPRTSTSATTWRTTSASTRGTARSPSSRPSSTASHDRGIRVVLDLVLNHTSHLHPWFEGSRSGRTGPYADWYIWADSPGRSLTGRRRRPNNWRSFFGGPAWTWDETRQQFYMHTFLAEQPDLNWRNPEVRAALMGVVRTWLDRGVDGLPARRLQRLLQGRAAALQPPPDRSRGAPGRGSATSTIGTSRSWPARSRELRALVDAYPGTMTVGELFDGSIAEAAANFRTASPDLRLVAHLAAVERAGVPRGDRRTRCGVRAGALAGQRAVEPRPAAPRQPLRAAGDLGRRGRRAGEGRRGDAAHAPGHCRSCTTARRSACGTSSFRTPRPLDPPARRASFLFPWWNRDQCRGPMSWRGGPGAGFTTGRPVAAARARRRRAGTSPASPPIRTPSCRSTGG